MSENTEQNSAAIDALRVALGYLTAPHYGDTETQLWHAAEAREAIEKALQHIEQPVAKPAAYPHTLIEEAFCEGFSEGYGGTWIEGDYSYAWKAFAKSRGIATALADGVTE